MARFFGKIGFSITGETVPGVWTDTVTERNYYGDVLRNTGQHAAGESINDNLNIGNQFSILADPFANENFHNMRYVNWMGANWKITSVEVQYPRLILQVGGVYNGPTAGTA